MLILCLVINLGLLFTFKYLDFGLRILMDSVGLVGWSLDIPLPGLILPVGISFYTFQTLSYTFDIYRRATAVEYHPGRFALFVNFFPQLVAGPIERSAHLLPQFKRKTVFDYARVRDGLMLALWGAFKKICIADLVATPVRNVFDSPTSYNGSLLLAASLLFCVQIYCDFSGYSDIAIGLAKVFGFELITNFRQPYTATSIAEFWRRWHISLGNWFRDYVYIPLGGNRGSLAIWIRNTLIVFFLSGLWHGAAWTFIVFGLIHGGWIVVERFVFGWADRALKERPHPMLTALRWCVTQLVVLVGFIAFVAHSLQDFGYVMAHLLDFGTVSYLDVATLGLPNFSIVLAAWHILILAGSDILLRFRPHWFEQLRRKVAVRFLFCLWLVFSIGMFGVFERIDFIYFQF